MLHDISLGWWWIFDLYHFFPVQKESTTSENDSDYVRFFKVEICFHFGYRTGGKLKSMIDKVLYLLHMSRKLTLA